MRIACFCVHAGHVMTWHSGHFHMGFSMGSAHLHVSHVFSSLVAFFLATNILHPLAHVALDSKGKPPPPLPYLGSWQGHSLAQPSSACHLKRATSSRADRAHASMHRFAQVGSFFARARARLWREPCISAVVGWWPPSRQFPPPPMAPNLQQARTSARC